MPMDFKIKKEYPICGLCEYVITDIHECIIGCKNGEVCNYKRKDYEE
jgi:hypothetical protein